MALTNDDKTDIIDAIKDGVTAGFQGLPAPAATGLAWWQYLLIAAVIVGTTVGGVKLVQPKFDSPKMHTLAEIGTTAKLTKDEMKGLGVASAEDVSKVKEDVGKIKEDVGALPGRVVKAMRGDPDDKSKVVSDDKDGKGDKGADFVSDSYEASRKRIGAMLKADASRITTSEVSLRATHNRLKNEAKRKGMPTKELDKLDEDFEKLVRDRRLNREQVLVDHEQELREINEQRKETP